MKNIMRKLIPFMLVFALMLSCGALGMAESADDAAEAAVLLENIKGTYEPLFPIITRPEYDQLWLDPCTAVVGEEAAPQMAEMLKTACNGTICGQEAIDAFGDGSNGAQFDCLFINGVSAITFSGSTIEGADESGNQVFSHEYTYAGKLSLGGMMEGYLYETADENAGEFKYFYMMPDTPATTFHLEFRYGSNVDDLAKYNEGPYAYWLAAGFQVDADADTVKNVIELFCLENMDYSAHSEGSLAQLKDLGFEGKWIADMSPFGDAYAKGHVRSIDIAAGLHVTKASVCIAMRKLRENGYINMGSDNLISLTDKGYAIARKIYDRHRTLTKYLSQLGVPDGIARADACKIEHDLSDESFEAIRGQTRQ